MSQQIHHDAKRMGAYATLLGTPAARSEGAGDDDPHVDVIDVPPGSHGRDFHTLVTSGMSDLRLPVPAEAPGAPARWELVLYTSAPAGRYVRMLHDLARFPFVESCYLGHGHSMANGAPPSPLFRDSELNGLLFSRTVLEPDAHLADHLSIDGDPVHFLWVVPLHASELQYKVDEGLIALFKRFDETGLSHVLDEARPPVV